MQTGELKASSGRKQHCSNWSSRQQTSLVELLFNHKPDILAFDIDMDGRNGIEIHKEYFKNTIEQSALLQLQFQITTIKQSSIISSIFADAGIFGKLVKSERF